VSDAVHPVRAAGVFERAGFTVLPAPAGEPDDPGMPGERLGRLRELAGELLARASPACPVDRRVRRPRRPVPRGQRRPRDRRRAGRALTGHFVSLHLMDDVSLAGLSLLHALPFGRWRATGDARLRRRG